MGFKIAAFFANIKRSFAGLLSVMFVLLSMAGGDISNIGVCDSWLKSSVSYCMYDSTLKKAEYDLIGKTATYDMRLAKNESEACQMVLKARWGEGSIKVEFTDFVNEQGDVLESAVYMEDYIYIRNVYTYSSYPDALMPYYSGEEFSMTAATCYPLYIRVRSTADTAPGTYTATFTCFDSSNGERQFEATVTATVWNFTLPETPSCETAMGLSMSCVFDKHGVKSGTPEAQELTEKYYEFLLDHKISPYSLPVDILSPEADAYLNDERMTSFMIPYSGDDNVIRAYYNKLSQNPEWLAKGYFYPIDEPTTTAHYETYGQMTARLERLFPDYNMVTPFFTFIFEEDGQKFNQIELQRGRSSIMCPISNLYSEDGFAEQIAARKAEGDKSWWYVCCGPMGDYCNLFTHWEGIKHRLLFWQQKSMDVDGLLYWSTTYWQDVTNVWTEPLTTPWTGPDTFGDGSLLYNGNAININGPVGSLRLEAVTDGIEDFEYLTMAQELLGEEYVDKMISKLVDDLEVYTLSDELFAKVRIELGDAIAAAV